MVMALYGLRRDSEKADIWCCDLRSQLGLEVLVGREGECPLLLSGVHRQMTPQEEAWPGGVGHSSAAVMSSLLCGSSGGGRGLGARGRHGHTVYTQRASHQCGCAGG